MTLDHLGHQGVHRAAASRDIMQHVGTFGVLVQGSSNRLHLALMRRTRFSSFFGYMLGLGRCVGHSRFDRQFTINHPARSGLAEVREMLQLTVRMIRTVVRIVDQVLKTDLPMDIWMDSVPFAERR